MTREEAIKYVKEVTGMSLPWDDNHYEALQMAIGALEKDACEDYISRQAVLDKINEICFSKEQKWVDLRVSYGSNGQRDFIINFIENLEADNK